MKDDLQKLPSLDGWRMVSITLVLLAHGAYTTGFPTMLLPLLSWLDPGDLGVRFFFVISGFLITWLLLQEHAKNGRIRLKHFYLRRAFRILPVYFFYLLVLGLLTHYSQSTSAWVANLTFTTNFFWSPFPTAHFWSLGVEEQFYLLWPCLLIWALARPNSSSIILKVLVVPLLVGPLTRLLFAKQWHPEFLHILFQGGSFFARLDSLAYGCLAAVLLARWRAQMECHLSQRALGITLAAVALVFLPALLHQIPFARSLQTAFSSSVQAIGLSSLLLQSVLRPSWFTYRALNWRWVQHLGVLSYSIYIWQQMFCGTGATVFGVPDAWWDHFPMWLLVVFLVAHASYYLLERPLLSLRAKYRRTSA